MDRAGRRAGVLYISYDGLAEPLGQSQVAPYLRSLAALGYRITLMSFEKPADRADGARMAALAQGMSAVGIRWIPLAYHKWPSLAATAYDVAVGLVRALSLRAEDRAIVHARSYVAGLIAWVLKRGFGAKFLFDMRGFWPDERVEGGLWPRGRLYRVVKRLERRFVRDADAIVTLTRRSCATLREWIGEARVPLTVIPTCVALDRYAGVRPAGVPPVAPVFVYAGSLGTWYAGDEIVRFMEEALRRYPAARLVVLTRNRAEADAMLSRSPAVAQATQVVTADPADVPSWLKSADAGLAFYAPGFSRQATCPTKAGEYLAMGLPVVVGGGVGDMDELVGTHRVGAAIAAYSPSAQRQALDRLASLWADPDLGARCRDLATQHFGLEAGVARYRDVYESLGARPGRSRLILILCPYPPGTGPSQRFRFEQYIPLLEARGFEVEQQSFWDEEAWRILYKPGHVLAKLRGLVRGFRRRLQSLARARACDYVFIHLEVAPIGPPLIELALLAMGKRIIYDIDDAIFIARTSKENWLASRLRFRSKVGFLTKHAYKVITVNPFLRDWARRHHPGAIVVPTTIDPTYHRPIAWARDPSRRPVIGWTGSKSTIHYLDLVRPALSKLAAIRDFDLVVIADADPGFPELSRYRFVPWRKDTEIEDLMGIDIGLMPLPDDLWVRGKVGFKAIQYAALEIPSVVSDVGSGPEVVEDRTTGLLVPNEDSAWVAALTQLIDDPARRRQLGVAARGKILAHYAVPAQAETYVRLFS